MKAKEFIKKHGWNAVISAVKSTTAEETVAFESKDLQYLDDENPMLGFNVKVYTIPYNDVKRYVDAYELVSKSGGIDHAKTYSCRIIEQAIQLVESVDERD